MALVTGINGFGRFGLHLLKYWLDRNENANFKISYINEDTLGFDKVLEIIHNDPYVKFNKYKITGENNIITILEPGGSKHEIKFTNHKSDVISWTGEVDFFLECTGKNTQRSNCVPFLTGRTKLVVISATSWDPDKTLVFGHNHEDYDASNHKIISYGSCTVNAYVPLASYVNARFGIVNSDVNVVHNVASHKLQNTLNRKFCTLEKSALHMLPFLSQNNFKVNYTVVPYTGVSMIDFRFQLAEPVDKQVLVSDLEAACQSGQLKSLYGFNEIDIGPEVNNCTTFSSVFIKEGVDLVGDNLYLQGYFDTENSVNRYFDLVDYLADKNSE